MRSIKDWRPMRKRDLDNPHLINLPKDIEIVIGRKKFMLDICQDKRVLHLGCVDEGLTRERLKTGTLLHAQLLAVARELYGVDISEEGLNLLRQAGIPNLILGNVEHLDQIPELREKTFDVILAPEIIEHLNNPGLFLRSAKRLFHENTVMIITTPNAYRVTGLGYRLKGLEFVHPDHNYWFSWSTLSSLLRKNGYQIIDSKLYSFVDYKYPVIRGLLKKIIPKRPSQTVTGNTVSAEATSPIAHRFIRDFWLRVKSVARILSRRFLYKLSPFFADGLIVVVKPTGSLKGTKK